MSYTYDVDKFKEVFESKFTWLGGFMRNVRRFAGRTALVDPLVDETWTYSDLNKDCNRFANALKMDGVGKNDILLYQLPNCAQFILCYIAPQKIGAINSPMNLHFAPSEAAKILDRDKPKVYVYDCDIRESVWNSLERSRHKPEIILAVDYNGDRPQLPEGHMFFDEYVKGNSIQNPPLDFGPDMYAEATRLFTSGTTGLPKGIPLNNANEVLSAHDVIMHFPLNSHDVTMNMTPWFHRGGLHSGGPTPTLYVGACCVIMREFNVKLCLDYAAKYGISFLIGVPAVLGSLAARQERHPSDLSKLKGIVTMGSPLEKNACIRYQRLLTPNIFNGYGTTETFWNCFLRPYDLPEMSGSAGRACIDDEVRIVKIYDDKRAEPDDLIPTDGETTGEIIIASSFKSAMCYIEDDAMTEEKYYKGWFYTHDLGTWDENQFITVAGRKDDMIISRGENIYPIQVEEVLNECPGVEDCIVTGVPDEMRGEAIVAYIVKRDEKLTAQDLNLFCASHPNLPAYEYPRYYCFIDEVPYNATGKKQHFVVKDRVEEDLKTNKLIRP